jgi:hypothetical protein
VGLQYVVELLLIESRRSVDRLSIAAASGQVDDRACWQATNSATVYDNGVT